MAKVLIASLGSGRKNEKGEYAKANYSIENENGEVKLYKDENFVTAAIEKHFGINKAFYIGTVGSMWENLYSYYCKKLNIDEDMDYTMELYEITSNANKDSELSEININKFNEIFEGKVEIILTKYGMDTQEIFESFNNIMKIGDTLQDGDEIYLDITHSFRSNAMWMFLVMNYIKDVLDKNIEIKMISYGMFEASYENKKLLEEGKIAPIVNLKAFYDLMKWIKGASEFKEYGNSYQLLEMVENGEVNKKIKAFSDSLNLNYLGTIKRNIESMKRIKEIFDTLEGPGKLIIPKVVEEFLGMFNNVNKEYEFLFKLAEWNFNQKRYAMVAININEGIRELIANILEVEDRGNDFNNDSSKIVRCLKKMGRSARYESNNMKGTYQKKADKIYKIFDTTRKIRNEIAHSIGNKDTAINDIETLRGYIESINEMIKDEKFLKYLTDEYSE